MQVFRSIQDDDVVAGIGSVKKRLGNVVPGVSAIITKALAHCIEATKTAQIVIVLDADEEACRLGYCDAPSLKTLTATGAKFGLPIRPAIRRPGAATALAGRGAAVRPASAAFYSVRG